MKINLKTPAKINLFLELTSKRSDGYHNLQSIMQTVSLYDELTVESIAEDKIILDCNNKDLPTDETNIVHKAAKAIKEKFNIKQGAKIYINKEIPMGAGLGGGSSDAAATIKALVKLWDIKAEQSELEQLASKLGADVPFFLTGGTALCEGIGDIIKPLKNIETQYIVLVNPGFGVSTPSVYKRVKFPLTNIREIHKIARFIYDGSFKKSALDECFNRLEEFVLPYHPEISKIKTILKDQGCTSLMSGSGATVFGIAQTKEKAEQIKTTLQKENNWKVWSVTTTPK